MQAIPDSDEPIEILTWYYVMKHTADDSCNDVIAHVKVSMAEHGYKPSKVETVIDAVARRPLGDDITDQEYFMADLPDESDLEYRYTSVPAPELLDPETEFRMKMNRLVKDVSNEHDRGFPTDIIFERAEERGFDRKRTEEYVGRKLRMRFKKLIADIEDEHEGLAPREIVFERAIEETGEGPEIIEQWIEKLKLKGEVYEPEEDHLRTT